MNLRIEAAISSKNFKPEPSFEYVKNISTPITGISIFNFSKAAAGVQDAAQMSKVVFPIFLRGHPQAISQFHERNINNIKSAILTKAHRQSSNRIRRAFGTSPIAGSSNDVITGSLSGAKDLTSLLPPASSGAGRNARGAKLLVSGPDAAGIVASFSQLLYRHGCGIVDCASESSQRDDDDKGVTPSSGRKFFQRILFDHGGLSAERKVVEREVDALCATFGVKSKVVSGPCIFRCPRVTPQRFN
mmetsp:Transcript_16721/g.38819  ORF Transcript_16721/g.38819 Transcript_16721/m.38819 type:complete len:245 (+) Transcript_16721:295-1029(+)